MEIINGSVIPPERINPSTTGSFPMVWFARGVTTGGVATFYPTEDGTITGDPIFENILGCIATSDANTTVANNVPSAALKAISSDRRIVTVNVVKGTTVDILGGDTNVFVSDGTEVCLVLFGN